MPDWNPSLINPAINRYEAASVGWLLVSGAKFSTRLTNLGAGITPDPGDVAAWREAMGNVSNAAVVRQTEERTTFIADTGATVFDEAYSDGAILFMEFQNDNGLTVSQEIPNPDVSIFLSDGVTLDTTNALVIDLIAETEELLNNSFDPANSYAYVRGVFRQRRIKAPKGGAFRPTIAEPGVSDNPPDAPAT